ncbi:low temperature requirement protein A [Gordonia soli]|uniref:Low temperature requirement protein A n=1 Tax=Gordonia soli NBRC 108243 TaxID=1223545 RepID=M0QRZ8_9ACTN|nr:low temperature requirement protein A [Gordonia soli]GAC70572.1 hypothetical protein GS4_36_00580 [Gordonia soli NBRC 108243]
MTGRDPHQQGRVATNLELFYDLVFVVAFSVAGTQVAHALAEGHYKVAVFGYLLSTFAATWAWINFAWFASAFDTDDWFFRVNVLVQMVGVAIIALGMPPIFSSLAHGDHVDNRVLVLGYIVMRIGMVTQWARVAFQSAEHRRAALIYLSATLIAQVGWVAVLIADMSFVPTVFAMLACVVIEMSGPFIAETTTGGTPWHPHHIAERYALLTIITLGEGVVGTVAVLEALIGTQGWTVETAVLGLAAMAVTFAMWWMYFIVPTGDALHARRRRSFPWGYGHIIIFIAAAGVGAGLHVAALYIEHEAHIGPGIVVATFAIPLGVYCLGMLTIYDYLLDFDPITLALGLATVVLLGVSVWLAAAGVSVVVALLVAILAPVVIVVSDELVGAGRRETALRALSERSAS